MTLTPPGECQQSVLISNQFSRAPDGKVIKRRYDLSVVRLQSGSSINFNLSHPYSFIQLVVIPLTETFDDKCDDDTDAPDVKIIGK